MAMDTLAAAYAEVGAFDKAVELQRRVVDQAKANRRSQRDVPNYEAALKRYQAGQPLRLARQPGRSEAGNPVLDRGGQSGKNEANR